MQIYECFLTRKCMTTERGDCSIKAKSIGRNQQQFQLPHLTRRNRWTYRGPNRGMGLSSGFTIQKVEKWWKLFKRLGLDTLHIPQHVLLWGIKKQYIYIYIFFEAIFWLRCTHQYRNRRTPQFHQQGSLGPVAERSFSHLTSAMAPASRSTPRWRHFLYPKVPQVGSSIGELTVFFGGYL